MVDKRARTPPPPPPRPPTPPAEGVAALAPQFDLAVTASSRRTAAPIGTLSPQHTSSAAPRPDRPARSPPLVAADFLAECESRNVAARHFPTDPPAPTHPLPSFAPPGSAPRSIHHPPPPAAVASAPPLRNPQPDFDLFGLASLDLGPPVFEPSPPMSAPPPAAVSAAAAAAASAAVAVAPPLLIPPLSPYAPCDTASFGAPQPPSLDAPPPAHFEPVVSPSPSRPHPPPPASAPASATSPRAPREQPHPTRCVLLRNVPPGIDDDDIRRLLQLHGPLRDLGAQQRSRGGRGSVLATYYDLRHARTAVRALDGSVQFGRRIDARFQCPSDTAVVAPGGVMSPTGVSGAPGTSTSPCANQGTLVVFNLDNSTSAEDIRALFSTIGDVKEIRATPNKKHHKFVEFYDVRDAERAMRLLNKTEVAGKRIKIEISRPGGRASNLTRHASPHVQKSQQLQQAHLHHPQQASPPHQQQPPLQLNHISQPQPRHHHNHQHVPYHHQQDVAAYRTSTTSPRRQAVDIHTSNQQISASLLSSVSQGLASSRHGGFAQTGDISVIDSRSVGGPGSSLPELPGLSVGFDASLHALQPTSSFDGAFGNPSGGEDVDFAFRTPYDVIGGDSRMGPNGHHHDHHRTTNARHMYPNNAPDMNKFPSVSIAQETAPRYAADSYIQALYNSPGSDENRSAISPGAHSPTARSPFVVGKGDGPGTDITAVNLYKNAFGEDIVPVGGGFHGKGGPSGQARPIGGQQQTISSVIGDRVYAHKQGNNKGSSHAGSNHGGANKQHYNQQQHQGNAKYALDIRKVRSGEETRTALMIRNIPNKYNQKMLLGTLEEEHRGHFDFIYLPIDFKNKCNVGYAFINFTKPQYIEPFYNRFHGKKWGRFNSEKVCEITFARIQGRQQLIAHFQNSSLLLEDPKCRPVIFDSKGRQEEFPIGSHVRTRRGPSSRDAAHRACDGSPPFSPTKHRGRS